MQDIKLIAVDLDGTLLDSRKRVPSGFFEAVEALHRHGIRVVIASGRQYFNLKKLFGPLQDRLMFICENGALAFDGGCNLFHHDIDPELLAEPVRIIDTISTASVVLCGIRAAYIRPPEPEAARNIPLYYEERREVESPLAAALAQDHVVKIAVFDRIDAAANCLPLLDRFRGRLAITLAERRWLDFMAPGVNKGVAITRLRKLLGLRPDQCMAFGDYPNDLEMLRAVTYGYAMANAHPDVKAAARFSAPSNDEDGVMRVLRSRFGDLIP